ncbi:MarR family transcriptional regulator [Novosphingobium sp. SG720]|uniref:MarR family winged helix-turn-helix transcriptional regulator n=2 Tax=Novosphingobium TaxID=165696 RepID=UPI0014454733|nr:MarR family transcriptional regulator [Novosphingobium sp. SG720]
MRPLAALAVVVILSGMISRTNSGRTAAEPPRNAMDGVDEDAALLVDLLKLATFVANPMRIGVAEPLDLAPTDLRIILALGGEGELAGHELSEIMGVPPMNVSRALVALHHKGLVEPGEDLRNRRRKPFRLSEAGQAMFDRSVPAMAEVSRQLFADFNSRDRGTFRRAASRLLARMTQWDHQLDQPRESQDVA